MRTRWISVIIALSALPVFVTPPQAQAVLPLYSLSRLSMVDGRVVTARWNPCQPVITWRINAQIAASTSAGRAAAIADAKASLYQLSLATGLRFRYLGTTSITPRGLLWWQHLGDAELVIAWVNQSQLSHRTDLLQRSSRGWLAGTGGWQSWRWSAYAGQPSGAAIVRGSSSSTPSNGSTSKRVSALASPAVS